MLRAFRSNRNRPTDDAKKSNSLQKTLNLGLFLFRIIGLDLDKPNYVVKRRFHISFGFHVFIVLVTTLQFLNSSNKVQAAQDLCEPIIGGAAVVLKVLSLFYYKKEWRTLLTNVSHFKKADQLGAELLKDLRTIQNTIDIYLKFYAMCLYLLGLGMVFRGNLPLPPSVFIDFEKSPQHEIVLLIPIYIYVFMCYVFVAWDIIFFSILTSVYCEFDVVKQEFQNLNGNDPDIADKFAAATRHHELVLSCIPHLCTVSSIVLLIQFVSQSVGICMGLLTLRSIWSGNGPDAAVALQKIVLFVVAFTQVLCSCVAGNELTDQNESLGMAVFHSPFWLDAPIPVKKQTVMVIRRSQNHEGLTMCGLGNINLELFKIVLKLGVTFLNVLMALDLQT